MSTICIIAPSFSKYSTTFIRNQVDTFKSPVVKISTGSGLFLTNDEVPVIGTSFFCRIILFIERLVLKKSFDQQQNSALAKYFKKNNIDKCIVHFGHNALKVIDSCISAKVKLIVHFHGHDAYRYDIIGGNNDFQKLFRFSKYIVAVSSHMRRQLIHLGAPRNKVKKIVIGINKEKYFNSKAGLKKRSTRMNFLFVGRFVEKKAPHLTILAFSKAYEVNPNLRLTMIGDGPLLCICKEIVQALKLQKNVKFMPPLSNDLIQENMRKADAFIQHSKKAQNGDSEGTPVAILEALTIGLPVISTKHTGIPEVVHHGKNGFLSDENDTDGMAENILKVSEASIRETLANPENYKTQDLHKQVGLLENLFEQQ